MRRIIAAAVCFIFVTSACSSAQVKEQAAAETGKPKVTAGPVVSSAETLALIAAAEKGDLAGMENFLAAGADINGKTMDDLQVTPLMKASEKSQAAAVIMLLAKGADANVISRFGFTALMFASDAGSAESVEALLSAGADPDKMGHMMATALRWAKNDKIRQILIKAGAK